MIERKLRSKRVLVVLDDVDDVKQLEELAGAHDWFGEGSRIIITTRDEHLLTRHADEVYEVSLLSHDEAMELFRRNAYRKDKPIEDYEMLSEELVSYAGGLPLALKVLGSFLYDKNKDEWKCALARLKDIPDDEVTKRLKISYDGLTPDACDLHPGIGIKVLVQKSLIKVDSYGIFEMHDLIEEMAHYIVRGEHPKSPEKHNRIWKKKDIAYLCDMGAYASPMETEVLAFHWFYGDPDLSDAVGLSDVVANMKKLRWIHFDKYPASSFPSNFQPNELGYLELIESQQKELWHGYKHLPNLKILDVEYSKNLIRTPDFDGLPCLEELHLSQCCSLEDIHPSIGYHKRLVYVNMRGCVGLKSFPPIIQIQMLETLNLSGCYELQFLDIQSNMSLPNLKILDLTCSALIKTPDFEGLPCLERLILMGCCSLEEIHPSIGYHKSLVFVDMSGCRALKSFPPIIQMEKLETLVLSDCNQLQEFPDIESNMVNLHLPNLKILDLTRSSKLITTPNFDGLPCLERLILAWCKSLEEIHPSIGYHKRLVCVNKEGCVGLKSFPPIIQMQMLETLKLSYCHELQQFWDIQSNMSLPNLKTLDLHESKNLIKTPDFEGLPCLERLILWGCWSLEEIHPSIGYHKRLVHVNMYCCKRLKRFPPIIQMQMLETLILSECCELQQFPDIQSNMVSLVTLHLHLVSCWFEFVTRLQTEVYIAYFIKRIHIIPSL